MYNLYIDIYCMHIYIYINTGQLVTLLRCSAEQMVGQGTPGGGAASHCQSDASDGLPFF